MYLFNAKNNRMKSVKPYSHITAWYNNNRENRIPQKQVTWKFKFKIP